MGFDENKFKSAGSDGLAKRWRMLLASNLTEEEFAKIKVEVSEDGVILCAPPELENRAREIVGLPKME